MNGSHDTGVYISQLIRFARLSSHVDDFNTRNKVLTAKLLKKVYRYHKFLKALSKFYRRHFHILFYSIPKPWKVVGAGQEFVIFSNGCLDLSANLLIGNMVLI